MINKLVFTKSAVFDYEEIVCNRVLDKPCFRAEVESLLNSLTGQKRELHQKTAAELKCCELGEEKTRLKYYDPESNKTLLLFLQKGYSFGIMQLWILRGICEESDYDKEMEHNGVIEQWLEVELD